MNNLKRIIWLQSIFSEDFVTKSAAVSPAANIWQHHFIKSLKKLKIECFCIGHKYEPAFPRGPFFVKTFKIDLAKDIKNKSLNYVNLPYFRNFYLKKKYLHYLKNFNFTKGDIILTYNESFLSDVALKLKNDFNIPWISIVADLKEPKGCSGYVYLNWNYYKKNKDKYNKIHIDGGIYSRSVNANIKKNKNKIILYAGTIGGHAGVSYLIEAFNEVKVDNLELWLCGKGKYNEIQKFMYKNKNIKFLGYVSKKRLEKLCDEADIFVNPRPSTGNETNFPSKILLYLSFKKPIISTRGGLSPKYNNILFLLSNEKTKTLKNKINQVLSLRPEKKEMLKIKIVRFIDKNLWINKAENFIQWVNKKINC